MSKISKTELTKLLECLEQAYSAAGKEIKTAVLSEGSTSTLVLDNRKKEDLN